MGINEKKLGEPLGGSYDADWEAAVKAAEADLASNGSSDRTDEDNAADDGDHEPEVEPDDSVDPESEEDSASDVPEPYASHQDHDTDEEEDSEEGDKDDADPGDEEGQEEEEEDSDGEGKEDGEKEISRKKKWITEDHKKLFSLAKKLGIDVKENDVRPVTTGERRAFWKKMEKKKEAFRQQTAEAKAQFEEQAKVLLEKNAQAEKILSAIQADDFDGMAEAAGFKNMKELNMHFMKKQSDPLQKEVAELRKERAKAAEEKRERERAEELQRRQHLEEKRMKQHMDEVKEELLSSKETKKFASDDRFVQTLVAHQQQSWDGQEMIDVEEAFELAKADAYKTWESLNELFGPSTRSDGAQPQTAGKKAGKKRKRSISRSRASDATSPAVEELSDEEWINKFAPTLVR